MSHSTTPFPTCHLTSREARRLKSLVQSPMANDLINPDFVMKLNRNSGTMRFGKPSWLVEHPDSTEIAELRTILNLALCMFSPGCLLVFFIINYINIAFF